MGRIRPFVGVGYVLLGVACLLDGGPRRLASGPRPTLPPAPAVIGEAYGRLPLRFEANEGQWDPAVKFLSRGSRYGVFLTATDAVISLKRDNATERVVRMTLGGANPSPDLAPLERLPGNSNYIIGNDPSNWRSDVPNYSRVKYSAVYPGIDLVYYGNQRELEYDFHVQPGADPSDIRLHLDGADALRIEATGDLTADVGGSSLTFHKPIVYQEPYQLVDARYVVDDREVRFEIGPYDTTRPLVIDPALSYSTYLGGTGYEGGKAITVDANGNAYVTGYTTSTNFPTTAGAYRTTYAGGWSNTSSAARGDVFVAKLNKSGTALVYSTYIGGTRDDVAKAIAVDSSGNAYLTGTTDSTDFPITSGAYQTQCGNCTFPSASSFGDCFVLKLNSTGSALSYSTYLAGYSLTSGNAIAVDSSGNAYVAGGVAYQFRTTNPLVNQNTQGTDAFVAKFNSSGSSLTLAKIIGGSQIDEAYGVAFDGSGNVYIAGSAQADFPTVKPYQSVSAGGQGDAFLAKFNSAGTTLYATLLGGAGQDTARALAIDSSGNAYIAGGTGDANAFPTTAGAYQRTVPYYSGAGFLSKFTWDGTNNVALAYSTLLSGSNSATIYGLKLDASTNAYVAGTTCSTDFPLVNAIQTTYGGACSFGGDGFVTKFNSSGSALLMSTYHGGNSGDELFGLDIDSAGNAYVTGVTYSTNFPTATPIQSTIGGTSVSDVFISRIGLLAKPTISTVSPAYGVPAGGTGITISGTGFQTGAAVTIGGVAATNVSVASATSITATTPAHAAGAVDVVVDNPDFQSVTKAGGFTYGSVMTLDHPSLTFGATNTGSALTNITPAQKVTVTFAGGSTTWSASTSTSWLQITNPSGSGNGQFTVAVVSQPGLPTSGSATGTVTVSGGAANAPANINVTLNLQPPTTAVAPFGQIDTPVQSATGLQGAIGVTGWALDDVGVTGVKIYRNCLPFEPQVNCQGLLGNNVVFVGDAAFLAGARPDVEAAYPTMPAAYYAGWGYLMLTNMLPNVSGSLGYGGQGSLSIFAIATDVEGNQTLLGRSSVDHSATSITMDNASIAKPFGAIDTPPQGGTVSGSFPNFGWSLTPDSNTTAESGDILIPTNGSSMVVFIDGQPTATVAYNQCRGNVGNPVPSGVYCNDDVANVFGNTTPQLALTNRTANPTKFRNLDAGRGAIGAYVINTTAMTNGLHTIAWSVTDSAGRIEGIGSRFFNVLNSSANPPAAVGPSFSSGAAPDLKVGPTSDAILGRVGFDLGLPMRALERTVDGVYLVTIPELGRVELALGGGVDGAVFLANGVPRDLPVGARLDAASGIFTWMPPAGYLGTYRLVFTRGSESIDVDVTVRPIAGVPADEGEIRMALDLPIANATVHGAVTIAGWALDPQAGIGAGIDTIHAWAQRIDIAGAAPQFLGTAALGGERPDVASAFGAQFSRAGFGLTAALAPGTYEITTYAWCARTGRFEDARTATVTVR